MDKLTQDEAHGAENLADEMEKDGNDPDFPEFDEISRDDLLSAAQTIRRYVYVREIEEDDSDAPAPTINDIFELCEDHEFHLGGDGADEEESAESLLQIILVALTRWGNQPPAPAPAPVPVAERPWERDGWCDAEGRCWWFAPAEETPSRFAPRQRWGLYAPDPADEDTHCLPHWAILQSPQGEEVAK